MATTREFTLLSIEPLLKLDEGKESPETYQRCTKGHAWNFGFRLIGVSIDLSNLGLTDGKEEFCLLCLRDNLRESCGRVKDGPK